MNDETILIFRIVFLRGAFSAFSVAATEPEISVLKAGFYVLLELLRRQEELDRTVPHGHPIRGSDAAEEFRRMMGEGGVR